MYLALLQLLQALWAVGAEPPQKLHLVHCFTARLTHLQQLQTQTCVQVEPHTQNNMTVGIMMMKSKRTLKLIVWGKHYSSTQTHSKLFKHTSTNVCDNGTCNGVSVEMKSNVVMLLASGGLSSNFQDEAVGGIH